VKSALPAALVAVSLLIASAEAGPGGKTAPTAARLVELVQRLRRIELDGATFQARRAERLALLEEIAYLKTEPAAQVLIEKARSDRYADVHEPLLQLLARLYPDSPSVAAHFRERLQDRDNPFRTLARAYVLRAAEDRRDEETLADMFERGTVEDRFLALRALGRISSKHVLPFAMQLLQDPHWTPQEGSAASCATIARSVTSQEGPQAARLLLLLKHDPRFTKSDLAGVREATRLWRNPDLIAHIRVSALADPDPGARAELAAFLGRAGVEAARAPLLALASRRDEPSMVRAAAAEALGGLKIARGDLSEKLGALLADPDEAVRRAAVRGLAKLRVQQAARVLVGLLDGPLGAEARAALAGAESLPPETDWRAWLDSQACPLPEGT
jgi:HEAT repeat protein